MPPADPRAAYLTNMITSASPARLVTMMYDALLSDICQAESALPGRDWYKLNEKMLRAQSIVIELRSSLKPELWAGGPTLLALYNHLYRLLVRANISKDPALLAECRQIVEPLQKAWHTAAEEVERTEIAARAAAHASQMAG